MTDKQSVKKNGGARPGAGRPKGAKSATTLEIEAAAKSFALNALNALNLIAQKGKSESARVAAAVALLDRGFGRPKQAVEVGADDSLASLLAKAFSQGAGGA